MFRNKELQSIVVRVLIVQIIIALVAMFVVNHYLNSINTSIVEQNQALAGNILFKHPELESEIIPFMTKGATEDEIQLGAKTLSRYGYKETIDRTSQSIFDKVYPSFLITLFLTLLFLSLPLMLIIYREYQKIYLKVKNLYRSAEKVVEGDFNVELQDEGEGEFSILNHRFNQMADRLKNSLDTLEKEKGFLKNTISDISHQLKTPLSSLIMLNELMLEDKNMEPAVKQKFLENSKTQLERMEWLIINLLKVARIEAGAIIFKKDRLYLRDITLTAIEALKSKYPTERISIRTLDGRNGTFYGDKEWTVEAIINILKNAFEHSQDDPRMDITIQETPLFSTINIRDYGKGIDPKDLPYIFQRFYRGHSEVKADSIGIGLHLSKLIIESQEGSITVESKKGEGTSFRISFLLRGA